MVFSEMLLFALKDSNSTALGLLGYARAGPFLLRFALSAGRAMPTAASRVGRIGPPPVLGTG